MLTEPPKRQKSVITQKGGRVLFMGRLHLRTLVHPEVNYREVGGREEEK